MLYKNQGVNDVTYKVSNEAFNVKNEKFDPEATETNEKFNGGKDGAGTYKPGNDYITAIFSGQSFTRETVDFEKIQQDVNNGTIEDCDDLYDENGKFLPQYIKKSLKILLRKALTGISTLLLILPATAATLLKMQLLLIMPML